VSRRAGAAAGLIVSLALALAPSRAAAQPALIAAAPELDEQTGELVLYVAGRAPDGSPAPVNDLQLFIDGDGPLVPAGRDKIVDYAADHAKWTPPMAAGIVYLWCKDAPQQILDGIEALFRHIPGRVAVYPTPYGQGRRQVVTKLTATRVAGGEVADYPQIPGDQMKLEDAVRFNLGKLAEDRAPIKMLFIITDGRGPATGKQWGPFSALGEDLRRRGLETVILGLPAPVDKAEAAANVAELAEIAHAKAIPVTRGADLPAMIESMAEPLASFERVRFELPWLTARTGGDHRLQVRGSVRGAPARAAAVPVSLPRQLTNLLLMVAAAVILLFGATIALLRRRRPRELSAPRSYGGVHRPAPPPPRPIAATQPRRDHSPPPVIRAAPLPLSVPSVQKAMPVPIPGPISRPGPLPSIVPPLRPEPPAEVRPEDIAAVAEVLRVGATPPRAILALARRMGNRTDEVLVDPRLTSDGDPTLASRAGQGRLRDLRRLTTTHPARDTFLRELAPIVCGALRDQTPPREAARRLRARLPLEVWSALLRLGAEPLDQAITAAATALTDMGTPSARAYVRDVQRELGRAPVAPLVVWLVRVAGPGAAGQAITIRATTTVGGPGSPTVISDDDPQLLPNLAEIMLDGNDAILTPLSGPVELDGEEAPPGSPLCDAQTLGLGACLYVVRLVRRDVVLPAPGRMAPAPTQR
jgi:hypothetical protein